MQTDNLFVLIPASGIRGCMRKINLKFKPIAILLLVEELFSDPEHSVICNVTLIYIK